MLQKIELSGSLPLCCILQGTSELVFVVNIVFVGVFLLIVFNVAELDHY